MHSNLLQLLLLLLFSLVGIVTCVKTKVPSDHHHHHRPLLSFFTNKRRDGNPASMCRAHSHNDYHQADPLSSALKHGLKSVEVDVFPRQGGLWVAHTVFGLNPKRTIESMYLEPLVKIFRHSSSSSSTSNSLLAIPVCTKSSWIGRRGPSPALVRANPSGGSDSSISSSSSSSNIHHDNESNNSNRPLFSQHHPQKANNLNLLVDFKGDADQSATLLQKSLATLRPFLSKVDKNGIFHQGRLTVLISGNRPSVASLQAADGERFLFLDGRVHDIANRSDTHLVPLVSLPWRHIQLARTMGRGEAYMQRVSAKAHAQGKLVRIWGCPNNVQTWRQMVRGNIDLLSIDDHAKFAKFVAAKHCL